MTKTTDVELGISTQRSLRTVMWWCVLWPPISLVLTILSHMPWTVLTSWSSVIMIYMILHNRYGPIRNWWWLWRGPILPLDFGSAEQHQWLSDNMPGRYVDLHTAVKFKQRNDAMWYKLVWYENS